MICYHEQIPKKDIGGGVILQVLGFGKNMNVLHWNMADQSVVPPHNHPQEQFGYVIKGGFDILVDGQRYILKAGDAYFIPPNAVHTFTALGETEAIDVFNPIRENYPGRE